ncbi:hypothetical protein KM043_001558 [Ampulex compressa]|nr:hypothetical protein KM043_001558 [Ampulex compressa]
MALEPKPTHGQLTDLSQAASRPRSHLASRGLFEKTRALYFGRIAHGTTGDTGFDRGSHESSLNEIVIAPPGLLTALSKATVVSARRKLSKESDVRSNGGRAAFEKVSRSTSLAARPSTQLSVNARIRGSRSRRSIPEAGKRKATPSFVARAKWKRTRGNIGGRLVEKCLLLLPDIMQVPPRKAYGPRLLVDWGSQAAQSALGVHTKVGVVLTGKDTYSYQHDVTAEGRPHPKWRRKRPKGLEKEEGARCDA